MKKGYKSPNTATVKLNLNGSVLNTVPVNNGSPHGRWEDAAAKKNLHNDEPEDETYNKPNWDE